MKTPSQPITGFLVLAGLAVATSLALRAQTHFPASPLWAEAEGHPYNGGKPHAPVSIEQDAPVTVNPDQELDFGIRVTPFEDCAGFRIEVLGTDGVQVTSGGTSGLESCQGNVSVVHLARVRVPARVAGYVAATVTLTYADGRTQAHGASFPLQAPGIRATAPARLGRTSVDGDGHPVVILKSTR
jgi:hypothetical protein